MATRRVKRIKRTKKHLQHGRRKTNRRHQTNRHRYTRRQRGGTKIEVCKKKGLFEAVASGIDITYNTETHLFKIGTQPTISELGTFNGKNRYVRAVFVLKMLHRVLPQEDPSKESTELIWIDFVRFVEYYCHNNSDEQCAQMKNFINDFKKTRDPAWPPWKDGMIADKYGAVSGRSIKTSIETALRSISEADLRAIAAAFPPTAAAASATDTVPTCQEYVNRKGTPNSIILTKNPSCIAYVNHNKIYEIQSLSGTTRKYSFKNFTIQLNDNDVINGILEIDFSNGVPFAFTLKLDLNGREHTNTKEFVTCMDADMLTVGAVIVQTVTMEGSMLKVIGTGTLQKIPDGEMCNFQSFVANFAEQYKFCTEGSGQRLEDAEQLNRSEPRALVFSIKGKMKLLDKTMVDSAQYIKLKQMYSEFMSKYPDNKINATPQNLATLNAIHDGMTALLNPPKESATKGSLLNPPEELATKVGQLTLGQTGDELAAKLAALKDD